MSKKSINKLVADVSTTAKDVTSNGKSFASSSTGFGRIGIPYNTVVSGAITKYEVREPKGEDDKFTAFKLYIGVERGRHMEIFISVSMFEAKQENDPVSGPIVELANQLEIMPSSGIEDDGSIPIENAPAICESVLSQAVGKEIKFVCVSKLGKDGKHHANYCFNEIRFESLIKKATIDAAFEQKK